MLKTSIKNKNLKTIKEGFSGNILCNNRYSLTGMPKKSHFTKFIKWIFMKNPQKDDLIKDLGSIPVAFINSFQNNSIYWLGHASFYINILGIKILIDPIFFSLLTNKRYSQLPCNIEDIKNIDYMLISHDHYDHLDIKSIYAVKNQSPNMKALIPLNTGSIFKHKHLKTIVYEEAGWYQKYNTKDNISIIFLPADHWCRRSFFDQNKRLWGSFLIKTENVSIFFAGDTAFNEELFKEINSTVGNIDICIMPVGCYSPSFMMREHHMNPEEAAAAFNILGGKKFIPMHYGTFSLGDEPASEPLKRLRKVLDNSKIAELNIGQRFIIGDA